MKVAGKNNRHGKYLNAGNASDAIVPQLAIGGVNPKPKKLRKASVKMAEGMVNVIVTKIGPIEFGIKCLLIILDVTCT